MLLWVAYVYVSVGVLGPEMVGPVQAGTGEEREYIEVERWGGRLGRCVGFGDDSRQVRQVHIGPGEGDGIRLWASGNVGVAEVLVPVRGFGWASPGRLGFLY